MKFQDSVFNQLLKVLPRYQFDRLIEKHKGDYRVRKLGCREQFLALLYAQLTGRRSLRDIEVNFNANRHHFYHLGCRSEIKRSTLADANNHRPVALYSDLFQHLVGKGLAGNKKRDAQQFISLLDSTTITLDKTRFGWAIGHKSKSGIKIHTVYDLDAEVPTYFEITPSRKSDITAAKALSYEPGRHYVFDRGYYDFQYWKDLDDAGSKFVTRLKKNSPTTVQAVHSIPEDSSHILVDQEVTLNQRMARNRKNPYQKRLREIIVNVEGKEEPLRLITNDMKSSAESVADLYKKRWQIELFFKWIKQNLKIKSFLGHSENAVKIQVFVAMIAYILLRLLSRSLFPTAVPMLVFSRLVETNLMRRVCIYELLYPKPQEPPRYKQNSTQACFHFA